MRKLLSRLFGGQKMMEEWRVIQSDGHLIAERTHADFHIELYQVKPRNTAKELYFEVWRKQGLREIYWIEKQSEDYVVRFYNFPTPFNN